MLTKFDLELSELEGSFLQNSYILGEAHKLLASSIDSVRAAIDLQRLSIPEYQTPTRFMS